MKEKMKGFIQSTELKVAVATPAVCTAVMGLASAAEGDTSSKIDTAAINAAFTSGFNDLVINSIGMISAMTPIALTLAGTIYLVRKAMGWFKGIAK